MKNKNLLFSLALTVAGGLLIIALSGISDKNKYIPRTKQNHKETCGINGAIEYLKTIRNNQITGEIASKWVLKAREDVALLAKQGNKTLNLSWSELGPDNIGGRTRAILIDKNNPNIMYAGGVCGGLWKSTTAGSSWFQVPSVDINIAVVSLAQGADGAIYAGTGEGLAPGDGAANGNTGFLGKGVFKSSDGITFFILTSTTPTNLNTPSAAWAYVNRLACDPVNANRVYAATNKGFKISNDGGVSWLNPIKNGPGFNTTNSTDVDVASDGTVIVALGGKCYISPNGNDSSYVCQSAAGVGDLPSGNIGRIEFAVAPSNPNYIYANAASSNGKLKNIYRSIDKGDTWTVIGPGGSSSFNIFGTNDQGTYDNVVVVHPTDPNRIYIGGIDMWGWKLGENWEQKTVWFLSPENPYYIHADHHFYVFHPSNSDIMYVGSDGGISRSTDGGETFKTMNIDYNTIQSYAVACSPTGMIMTGTQDNGTLLLTRTGAFTQHASHIMGGDGGWPAFSYINPEAYFATMYYAATKRSPDKGETFYPGDDGSNPFFSARMVNSNQYAAFVTPLLVWESFNDIYSTDSIKFTPASVVNEKIGKGSTGTVHFTGTFARDGQANARIVPGTVEIRVGSIYVTDDGNGQFIGATGIINYNNGTFDITFATAPSTGLNILASYNTKFDAGSSIVVISGTKPAKFNYTSPVSINMNDTVMIQDIVQSKFYLGFSNAIWMTKDALDFSKRPEWYKISSFNAGGATEQTTQCMTISQDGNYLFVGTSNGYLFRISNLRTAQDSISADVGTPYCVVETKQLTINNSTGRAVTSIAVDPANANNVIVTLGNYGNNVYVYYSNNALAETPVFNPKQGNLPKMPVYSSLIPLFHSGSVIIGTEYGIYSTDNINSNSPVWTDENTGLGNVPVYMLRQQTYNYNGVTNYGSIYAGTHGRGVFECTKYTAINEPEQPGNNYISVPFNVSVYPNPVVDNANLSFTLPKSGNVKIHVYNMNGKIVKSVNLSQLSKGFHTYSINCNDLKSGTYVIQMNSCELKTSAKFLVY